MTDNDTAGGISFEQNCWAGSNQEPPRYGQPCQEIDDHGTCAIVSSCHSFFRDAGF